MVLGYLLVGWIGGMIAAGLHLATGGQGLGSALGHFVLGGNLAMAFAIAAAMLRADAVARRVQNEVSPPFDRRGHGGGPS